MSEAKVNHNVYKAFDSANIVKATSASLAAGTNVSDWIDVSGWTDKALSVASAVTYGSGSIDLNIDVYVSAKDKYVLDNEATVDTQDYQVVQIVDNLTTGTYKRYDSADVDDLQRPIRSLLVALDNGDASDALTVDVWVEGWS